MATHDEWMAIALDEARIGYAAGEVPVGAVLVQGERELARAHNRRESRQSPLSHAELDVIAAGAELLGSWRLCECTLYVTLEPCVMCAGALVQARVPRLVFGCRDPKAGAVCSLYECATDARLNHRLEVIEGVGAEESAELLRSFFRGLRHKS